VKERIERALVRNAETDAAHITVLVKDHTATLRGTVRSHAERRAAEASARSAPGITQVNNRILVEPSA
jgi:osmotically-inducible protein OsmY